MNDDKKEKQKLLLKKLKVILKMNIEQFRKDVLPNLTSTDIVELTDLINVDALENPEVDANGKKTTYTKYPTIREPNLDLDRTPIEELLWLRCNDDIVFYAENYFWIITHEGDEKIKLRNFQKKALKKIIKNKYFLMNAARQIGKSTLYTVFCAHYLLFNKHKTCGLVSKDLKTAGEIAERIKYAIEKMPLYMQSGMKAWNDKKIQFENGNRLIVFPTTTNAGTGYTFQMMICDEFDKIPKTVIDHLWGSIIPAINSGGKNSTSKLIIVSTPFFGGKFKDLLVAAKEKRNSFSWMEVTYKDVPQYNNDAFIKETKETIGELRFRREYCVEFVSFSGSLIEGDVLDSIVPDDIIFDPDLLQDLMEAYSENIKIFEKPIPGHVYVIGCDPNESNGRRGTDDTVADDIGIHVIDVTDMNNGYTQCLTCHFEGDQLHYMELPAILYNFAKLYNDALICVENNLGGKQICQSIYDDYYYERIYSEVIDLFGYRLKNSNKMPVAKTLKLLIEQKILKLNDTETILQLKTYIKGGGSYMALAGYQDGLVTSLFGAILFLTLPEDIVEEYFGDTNFTLVCTNNIMKSVYRLNPAKKKEFEYMNDFIVRVGDGVKNEFPDDPFMKEEHRVKGYLGFKY